MKRTQKNKDCRSSLQLRNALYLALFSSTLAAARPADEATAKDAIELQAVTVSGPNAMDLRRDEITNMIVVGRDEIQRHNDNTLSGVLRRLPGLTISPADGIRMRGLGAGYVQVLIDGTPAPADFFFDSIAPDLIERIEIMPTPVAEYSTRSIAGTINIVLRKVNRPTQRTLKLNAARDGAGWYPSMSLLLSGKSDDFSWSINGTASQGEDHSNALLVDRAANASDVETLHRETREVFEGDTATYNIAPRLSWSFENGDTLTWQSLLQYGKDEWIRDRTETVILGGPSEYPRSTLVNDARILSGRTDLNWLHNFSDDRTLSVKFGVNYYKRDTDFHFLGFEPAGAFALDREVISDAIDTSYTSVGKYLTKIGKGHSLGFGWDGAFTRRTESRLQHDWSPQGDLLDVIDDDYTADVSRLALYAQDEWQTTSHVRTYLGLRWEGWDTSVSGPTIASFSNRSNELSPIVQLVWKLSETKKDQVRFGFARTFNAPQPRLLVPRRYTVNNGNSPTNPDKQGNPDLRPEVALGLDAAYEHYFGENGMVSLSAYVRRIDDAMGQALFEDEEGWVSAPVNAGKARTHGLTIEAKFSLSDLLQTSADIQLHGNLTRNWSSVEQVPGPNNTLGNQTPLSGNIGMEWRPTAKISTGMDFSYVGDNFSRWSSVWSASSWPERNLSIYGNWMITSKDKISLSLSNVLHQRQGVGRFYEDANGSNSRFFTNETSMGIKLLYERQL